MAKKTLVYQEYLIGALGLQESTGDRAIKIATKRLDIAKKLGATHVWIGPIMQSPWMDHGYDVTDPFRVDSAFGTFEDFDAFVERAHELGIKVVIDLILNHISDQHEFYEDLEKREKFCFVSDEPHNHKNLFSKTSAWYLNRYTRKYELSLFTPEQKDLLWFPGGLEDEINRDLVDYFHAVVDFWTYKGVDGFRLDAPQALNKNMAKDEWTDEDFQFGDASIKVLNAVFNQGREDLFLMAEIFDPTFGDLIKRYLKETPVNYVLNVLTKEQMTPEVAEDPKKCQKFLDLVERQAKIQGFMLDFESHDSRRFPTRGVSPEESIEWLFKYNPSAICLFNGEELGLGKPTFQYGVRDHFLTHFDAKTQMLRDATGEMTEELRQNSRANARVTLPKIEEYEEQIGDMNSIFSLTRNLSERWKNTPFT